MRLFQISRLVVMLLLATVLAAACNSTPPEAPTAVPTAVPTADSPTIDPTDPPAPEPTATSVAPLPPAEIDWPPQTMYTVPTAGQELPVDSPITVRFDQPMNAASVEAAWALDPAVAGDFDWPRPDTLVFSPAEPLKHQASYRVQVSDSAEAQNGQTLTPPLDVILQTVGFLEVIEQLPAPDSSDIDTDAAITVVFNRPVVPLTSSDQQGSLPQPVSLSPAVAGTGEWVTTAVYRFTPDAPLAGATTYTATVAAGLEDLTGGILQNEVVWRFTTLAPEVVSTFPANGASQVLLTSAITVTFNMPMDRASTETAFALRTDAAAVALDYAWEDDDRTVVATPQQLLELETIYDVVIAQSARSASGSATLTRELSPSFQTIPFPAVINSWPEQGTTTDPWMRGVNFSFASPMDPTTLEELVEIDPPPAKAPVYSYNEWIDPENPSNSSFNLNIDFEYERDTAYTVTVPASAADIYGNTFGEPFVLSFTSPPPSPVASFNLPMQVSQLTTSFPSNVEVVHRNIDSFTVSLTDLGVPVALLAEPYNLYDYRPSDEATTFDYAVAPTADDSEVGITQVELAAGERLPTGIYMLSLTAPGMREDSRYWQNQSNLMVVADTNLIIKEMPDELRVWATDLESGAAVDGVTIRFYNSRGAEIGSAETDANGFATLEYQSPNGYLEGAVAIAGETGQAGFGAVSTRWTGDINPWQMGINAGYGSAIPEMSYIYTDRPIYRPGDTVHIKGIVRDNQYARFGLPQERTVDLVLDTAFYVEDGVGFQERIPVTIGANGNFSAEIELPDGIMLGSYNLRLDVPDIEGLRAITVAEYRRPEYQVTLTSEVDETLRGEPVQLDLQATYFFGASAGDLSVSYSIYEQEYWPFFEGLPYAYGDQAGFEYQQQGFFGPGGGSYGSWIAGGDGVTDEDGRFQIELPAELLADVAAGSRRVTVEAFVNDISNFPITTTAEVLFHAADGYVGIRSTEYGSAVDSEVSVDLQTVDWAGDSLPDQAVEVAFYLREWESTREPSFTQYQTVWTPVDTEVARTAVVTDDRGQATAAFVPTEPGSYIAVSTLTDAAGRTQMSSTYLWIIDDNFSGWRTDSHVRTMDLIVEKESFTVGETARILVQSPFSEPTQAWLFLERGNMVEQRLISLNGGTEIIDLPITAAYAPNVFVTIATVKPVNRASETNPYADIRIGLMELRVEPDQFEIQIDITPRGDLFQPGDTALFDILTTNGGSPVSAEVSVALVDLAILSLTDDNAPPIMEAFYSPVPLMSNMGSGLLISGEGLEVELPLENLGGGGGGGGEQAADALGKLAEEDDDTRRDFPDTAYWNPAVTTSADGTAEVEIPLPDTLTTWRLNAKAVTLDTKVGQDSADIISTLPLLLRPVTPRFFTVDDVVQIGAIVNNNTAEAIEATVTLEADGFVEETFLAQTISVPANGKELLRWPVTVADVEFVDMTFRVEGGGYSDATKPSFGVGPDNQVPVYRYDAPDITGTANEMLVAGQSVEAILLPPNVDTRRGSVDVKLSPSLAAALIDALTVVEKSDYDTNCAHAVVDRLLPNLATELMITDLELELAELLSAVQAQNVVDVAALDQLQRADGGWGFCLSSRSDPWLSAYGLLAMAKAQEAGYETISARYNTAVRYVEFQLEGMAKLTNSEEVNRQAFFLYVLAEAGTFVDADADELVEAHRGLLDAYAKGLLVSAYEVNGATGDNQAALLSDLSNEAIVSATSAHWEDMEPDYFNLSSDVRGTAMVIDALSRSTPDSSLLDGAVRWLMVARTAEIWRTSHETAWAIFALSHYLASTGELDADYPYQLNVNTVPLAEGAFSAETITDSESITVPIKTLLTADSNYFDFRRGEGAGKLYYTMHLNSYVSAESVAATSRPITVSRAYFDAACDWQTESCEPIESISAGEQVRVVLTIVAPNDLVYAVVEDPFPSGAEGIDPNLNTTQANRGGDIISDEEPSPYGYWGWWHFDSIEYRDEKVRFTSSFLPAGTYQYSYFLQTSIPGEFQVMPALAYQTFFPETFGRSDGKLFAIVE